MQGSSRGSEVAITEEERDHFQMICFTYQSFNALKKKRQTRKQFYIDLEEIIPYSHFNKPHNHTLSPDSSC